MNGHIAKKIRKKARRDYKDAVREILKLPWYQRIQWAWFVLVHHIK